MKPLELEVSREADTLALEVRTGLTASPKRLQPTLLYDERGSALFEAITELPEYYPTRTEAAILEAYAPEMLERVGLPLTILELGAGTAKKTLHLLEALLTSQRRALYVPIDLSATALEAAAARLLRPGLTVQPLVGRYERLLLAAARLPGRRLVLFLGSSLGNYEPNDAVELLACIRAALASGDALLLGVDLAKDAGLVLPAYDDAAGTTAAFNKNVLTRLNRELAADFDVDAFSHVALWNEAAGRIEMHLESLVAQEVRLGRLGMRVRLRASERIHTESSYKRTHEQILRLLRAGGLSAEAWWMDGRGWFGSYLARVP